MNQTRSRFPVGVMAIVCLFLALSVVAHESEHPGSVVIGDSSVPLETMTTSTPVHAAASSRQTGGNNRHRQTRETLPLPKPPAGGIGEEYVGSSIDRAATVRRRRMEPQSRLRNHLALGPLVFMPARGRRFGGADKRQITIEQMLEKGDYFVPNRGKKATSSGGGGDDAAALKKTKFDVLLGTDEYFFPNRGKKEYLLRYSNGRFRPLRRTPLSENGSPVMGGIGGAPIGSHPLENRLRRNLLENLANEHKDTFFSSRGKRIPEAYGSGDNDSLVKFEQLAAMDDCETSDECGMASQLLEQNEPNGEPDALLVDDDILLPIL
ncbi:uncharacterized protein LOC125956574 [Anopheles darlingi]|uniref:uncharacterized protein LOC125956574 n=1 Tax=Anopheles darlingi TaxID=43151 RepID=UPI00210035DC|nr:uncharacterized protein LOC125956574 [Anopheles darlingi]